MKAYMHLRKSNLTWNMIKSHFTKFSSYQCVLTQDPEIPVAFQTPEPVFDHSIDSVFKFTNTLAESFPIKKFEVDTSSVKSRNIECSVHSCEKLLKKDLSTLFPDRQFKPDDDMTVVSFNHRTNTDMGNWDKRVAREREFLAVTFIEHAKDICEALKNCGYWADFIDPYSATPYYGSHTNDSLTETDPRMRHFGYQVRDLGCCKVLSHPLWNEHVFAGLIFTNAPSTHSLIQEIEQL